MLEKYGVVHNVVTLYQPQTSGKFEVSNKGIKQILAKAINANRTDWSRKLDDALWAYSIANKTLIDMSLHQLVYGKACHLLIELDHKAVWEMKRLNLDWMLASK